MLNQVLKVSSGKCRRQSVDMLSKSVTFLDFDIRKVLQHIAGEVEIFVMYTIF